MPATLTHFNTSPKHARNTLYTKDNFKSNNLHKKPSHTNNPYEKPSHTNNSHKKHHILTISIKTIIQTPKQTLLLRE